MPWGFAAAGVASAAGGIFGASKQSSAVKEASKEANQVQREAIAAQKEAAANALGFQREAVNQLRVDLQPYNQAGGIGLQGIGDILGASGQEGYDRAVANFRTSPGYQFAVNEGVRAASNQASAQGLSNSGAVLKALQARGQGLADQQFDTYYNRLAALAQMGQNSAAMVGTQGMNAANAMGNTLLQSAGQIGQQLGGIAQTQASLGSTLAGIQGNMYQGIGNAVNSGLNNALLYSQLNGGGGGMFGSGQQAYQPTQPGALYDAGAVPTVSFY